MFIKTCEIEKMTEESVPNFEIILGTYEEFTLGYKFRFENKKCSLVQSFATHDHSGSVRTVSTAGRYAATGASDDRVIIYDMIARREQSVLTHHNGTVNCVAFTPDGTHLLTAGDDGVLSATRSGNWQIEKVWAKSHGGTPVKFIAIHPSGKLALTLGNDITLRTWNLVKGRQAYVVRLQPHMRSADTVSWSSDEKTFAIFSLKHLELWNIEQGGCLVNTERKLLISSIHWIGDNVVVGHEDGSLVIFDKLLTLVAEESVHTRRIKCINSYQTKWIISADSSGKIIVWKWRKNKLIKKCDINAGCRITCMTIVKPFAMKKGDTEVENIEETVKNDKIEIEHTALKKRKSTAFIVEEREEDDEIDDNQRNKRAKKLKNKQKIQSNHENNETLKKINKAKKKKKKLNTT